MTGASTQNSAASAGITERTLKLLVEGVRRELGAAEVTLLAQVKRCCGFRARGPIAEPIANVWDALPTNACAQGEQRTGAASDAAPYLERARRSCVVSIRGSGAAGILSIVRADAAPAFTCEELCIVRSKVPFLAAVLDVCKLAADIPRASFAQARSSEAAFDCLYDRKQGQLVWLSEPGAHGRAPELERALRDRELDEAGSVAGAALSILRSAEVAWPDLDGRYMLAHVLLGGVGAQAQVACRLSKREHEVARLLVEGHAAVNIAANLGISETTVRTYIRRLYSKLEVSTRVDFVRAVLGLQEDQSDESLSATL